MARKAFGLQNLDLIGVDSLLFISDNADPDAEGARNNGLGIGDPNTGAPAFGLEIAPTAPTDAPGDPDVPSDPAPVGPDLGGPQAGLVGGAGITLMDPQLMGAKGGQKGPPPSEPAPDPAPDPDSGGTPLSSYTSGIDNGIPDDQEFNIEITFKGSNWTTDLQQAFIDAANLISSIITGDIQDVFFRGKVIDDIRIDASLVSIDGVDGVLGRAGPTAYRTTGYLPATAVMQFDIADAEAYDAIGLFNDIVFHEMMHSIGFGTMWDLMGLVTDTGGSLTFNGINATAENGGSQVPIEDDTGYGGTDGGHWNEALWGVDDDGDPVLLKDPDGFDNEIMTGFVDDVNYLSIMTIAALEDMQYETVYGDDAAIAALDMSIFEDTLLS